MVTVDQVVHHNDVRVDHVVDSVFLAFQELLFELPFVVLQLLGFHCLRLKSLDHYLPGLKQLEWEHFVVLAGYLKALQPQYHNDVLAVREEGLTLRVFAEQHHYLVIALHLQWFA